MFKEIGAEELAGNPFAHIGEAYMLVSAGNRKVFNAATVSWGSLGRLWDKPVATLYLRPQSETKKIMDKAARFAVSFFSPEFRDALAAGGGKGPPKQICSPFGFLLTHILSRFGWKERLKAFHVEDTVSFQQASLILICKKLYHAPLDKDGFVGSDLGKEYYSAGDYHTLYMGEILKALISKENALPGHLATEPDTGDNRR